VLVASQLRKETPVADAHFLDLCRTENISFNALW